ncbi:hypothetical protein BGZ65_012862 [Modicella reniformis]|uniref:Uncharacterized protein n=1 Tax=Modicella reniformis TaxID=1440133 RepID=A0A9P6LTE3_9FUNG|nr:hypothetical protein BGZ65_012862 [Modicella reniformis]
MKRKAEPTTPTGPIMVIRDFKKPQTRITRTSSPQSKVEYFSKYFSDPPDVDDIVNGLPEDQEALEMTDEQEESDEESEEQGATSPYRRVQFLAKNRARIFRALLFLKNKLRDMAQLWNEQFKLSMSRYGSTFKELAADLANEQLSLVGVTGPALHSLYSTIVTKRRELNVFLCVATGDPWTDTRISDLAQELLDLDDEMNDREEKRSSKKAAQLAESKAKEMELMSTIMSTRDSRKRKERAADRISGSPTPTLEETIRSSLQKEKGHAPDRISASPTPAPEKPTVGAATARRVIAHATVEPPLTVSSFKAPASMGSPCKGSASIHENLFPTNVEHSNPAFASEDLTDFNIAGTSTTGHAFNSYRSFEPTFAASTSPSVLKTVPQEEIQELLETMDHMKRALVTLRREFNEHKQCTNEQFKRFRNNLSWVAQSNEQIRSFVNPNN